MKVLIVGNYGMVVEYLLARLQREKCDIFVLSGNRREEKRKGLPKHILFSFAGGSADVQYVIQGIMPDYIVFTGAWDENYDWHKTDCVAAYNSALVNILNWAREYRVPKFCYLSCMDAKEEKGIRGMQVKIGERICATYAEKDFQITTLRLPYIYGCPICAEDRMDALSEQIFRGKTERTVALPGLDCHPLYVSDLAEAVYRVGTLDRQENAYECFEVAGKERLTTDQFQKYLKEYCKVSVKTSEGELKLTDRGIPDGRMFEGVFGYRPLIDVSTGLGRSEVFFERNLKKIEKWYAKEEEEREKKKKKSLGRRTLEILRTQGHILENILLFLIALAAQVFFGENVDAFMKVDFFLIYIVLIATRRSVGESILAALLAFGGNMWMEATNDGFLNAALTSLPLILQFLFYFVIAICISYSGLRSRVRLNEQVEQLQDLEEEYKRIVEVNNTNVEIKSVFEDRLVNYSDSIGKIQEIVSELDVLEVDKIITYALRVVKRIMNVDSISIYCAGTEGYFHFVGATEKMTVGQKSFLLSDYKELEGELKNREVYVNREVGNKLPRMAAPIFRGDELIYIIMLWDMEFEDLNLYKKNLLLVLAKIITSSLERGYQYEQVGRYQDYYESTDIMRPEAFAGKVRERLEGKTVKEAQDSLIRVETGGRSLAQLNAALGGLIRSTDRMGFLEENEAYIYLLVHANYETAGFVVNKLGREGLAGEVVMLDEA